MLPFFKSEHWPELAMLAAALMLAAIQKAWRSYRMAQSQTWPVTHGSTLRAEATEQSGSNKVKIHYMYRVGEESFQGEFEKTFRDGTEAQWWADALSKTQVVVHYDPEKPKRSQLWESDLLPIVQSFRRPAAAAGKPFSEWERVLVTAGVVVSLAGCALSLLEYFGGLAGKAWLSPTSSIWLFLGGLAMAGLAALVRSRTGGRRAAPEWMSFALHALIYFAVLSSLFLPLDKTGKRLPRNNLNLTYQVLMYFGAFETFYLRLKDASEEHSAFAGNFVKM